MYGFPGEDRIVEAARERWEGQEVPEFGEHHPGCQCYDMTEEEYEEDLGKSCTCAQRYQEDYENDKADSMLSRLDD